MLNRNAIFVNGLSRGGTTILTNLLASHPDVCLIGETHHVFKGTRITDRRWQIIRKCLFNDAPILLSQWQNFFSPRLVQPRRPLPQWVRHRIDKVFYREKLRSVHPLLNRYKQPDVRYTRAEIAASRLLGKNIDGMIYANDTWVTMYADATFFGLVRNGLAVCEGHMRRGRSAAEIGWRYQVLVDKMLHDARTLPNYRLLRFEELIAAPWQTLQAACNLAGLDAQRIQQVRMQARRVMDSAGNHALYGNSEWDVVWLHPKELTKYFLRDVDANQIKRLSTADRDAFLRQAGRAMEQLGYATTVEGAADEDTEVFLLPIRPHLDSQRSAFVPDSRRVRAA